MKTPSANLPEGILMRVNGKDISEIFDECPVMPICHLPRGCGITGRKDFYNCHYLKRYLENPKVVSYITRRAIE